MNLDLARITDEQAAQLYYDWDIWSRPKQKEPPGDWRVWLILAGRGFGKTRTGAEWVRRQVETGTCKRLAFVGRTAADVRDVMVEGESGILSVSPPWNTPRYEPSKRRLTWSNGAIATTYSADEPDTLRGPQHDGFWCLTGDTLVLMGNGRQKPLADIRAGDYVMTRQGARRVTGHYLTKRNAEVYLLHSMDGRGIIGTAEHPVWVQGRGFVPMSMLAKGMSLCVTTVSNGTGISGINDPAKTTMNDASCSIGQLGSKLMALFQRVATSTTRTVTRLITGLKICNCLRMVNTVPCTMKRNCFLTESLQELIHRKPWRAKDRNAWGELLSVPIAGKNTIVPLHILAASAHQNVLMLTAQQPTPSRVKCASVSIAQQSTRLQSDGSAIVQEYAITEQVNSEPQPWKLEHSPVISVTPHSSLSDQMPASAHEIAPSLSMVSIASVEKLNRHYDVYDIVVEDAHEFFANGILVHNCDEPASWRFPDAWDQLMFGLRLGKNPRGVATTTPRPTLLIKALVAAITTYVTRGVTYENRANLAPAFLEQIISKYEGTRLGRQEIGAEILEDVEGALWQRDSMIEAYRVTKHPPLVRIGVAVDPATTSQEGSAETGIIVGGIAENGHAYILDDRSLQTTPEEWAKTAITCFYVHQADRIIAEVNQGGDMVETIVRMLDSNVSYQGVRATRGKFTRAEPVSSLYERGLVHHVGTFPELEDQLCSWVQGEKSPDRLDALVWLLTSLMISAGIPLAGDEPLSDANASVIAAGARAAATYDPLVTTARTREEEVQRQIEQLRSQLAVLQEQT